MKTLPLCPVETSLFMIGDKWKFLILRELVRDHTVYKRFSEIKKGIDHISDRMLSQNLKVMEEDKLILREVRNTTPLRVEYSLTELGRTLVPILKELYNWGEMYQRLNIKESNSNE